MVGDVAVDPPVMLLLTCWLFSELVDCPLQVRSGLDRSIFSGISGRLVLLVPCVCSLMVLSGMLMCCGCCRAHAHARAYGGVFPELP